MIRNIILDCGGVLVRALHGEWDIPAGLYDILGDRAANVPDDRWHEAHHRHHGLIREDVVLDIDGEYRQRRLFLENVGRDLGWNLTESELNALADDFTRNPKRYIWYDDVAPVLTHLHTKYRVGVLSDAMPSMGVFLRDFDSGRGLFDEAVFSTQIGICKPDPRMYREILRRMNADPSECVFVDDRACNLEGAESCGIRGIQMLRDGLAQDWHGAAVRGLSELEALWEAEN